jgi:valyl-tRNA synthetase
MKLLQDIVTEVRGVRADNKIDRKEKLQGVLHVQDGIDQDLIERLANVSLTLEPHDGTGYSLALGIPVDKDRLRKEIEQLEKVVANSQRQLANESFVAKAPAHVIDGMRAKLAEYEAQIAKNRAALGE